MSEKVLKEIDIMLKELKSQLDNPKFDLPDTGWAYRQGAENILNELKKHLLKENQVSKK